MPTHSKTMNIVAAGLLLGGIVFAQAAPDKKPAAPSEPPKSAKPAAVTAWRSECSKPGEFCIQVPKDWKSLGEVFDGAGFVVAEPDTAKPQDDWNQITAAATDMPEESNGHERPSTDELINIILGSPSSGIHAETLQRSKMIVADMPAEVLKIRLRAKDESADAIEFIALLDDGETIYSVALGCAPDDAVRLQPVFEHVLHSWKAVAPPPAPPKH